MLSLIKAEDKVICNSVSILLAPRNTIKMLIIFCRLLDIGVANIMETYLDLGVLRLLATCGDDFLIKDSYP